MALVLSLNPGNFPWQFQGNGTVRTASCASLEAESPRDRLVDKGIEPRANPYSDDVLPRVEERRDLQAGNVFTGAVWSLRDGVRPCFVEYLESAHIEDLDGYVEPGNSHSDGDADLNRER